MLYDNQYIEIRRKKGLIRINHLVNQNDNDYNKLYQIAEYFADKGSVVELAPKMSRSSNFEYESLYYDLIGTKYEGKCPDLKIDGLWYEHEGFVTDNPKRAFRNMLSHGLKQSNRIIMDKPDLTERHMKRCIQNRINNGEDIVEIWLRDNYGNITLLYKKTDG